MTTKQFFTAGLIYFVFGHVFDSQEVKASEIHKIDAFTEKRSGPIHFGETKLSDQAMVIFGEATEDFNAAVKGKLPIHAKWRSGLLDGGTVNYQGKGYSLVVKQTAVEIEKNVGFLYGPILKFENNLIPEIAGELSHVEFYSTAQMKKLKEEQ